MSDRDHTEPLFDFRFRIEIYVPKAKREFGYFVLPILHGDRLIGRIDPRFDRATGVLRVNAVYAEEGAPGGSGPAVRRAIDELADWRGGDEVGSLGSAVGLAAATDLRLPRSRRSGRGRH